MQVREERLNLRSTCCGRDPLIQCAESARGARVRLELQRLRQVGEETAVLRCDAQPVRDCIGGIRSACGGPADRIQSLTHIFGGESLHHPELRRLVGYIRAGALRPLPHLLERRHEIERQARARETIANPVEAVHGRPCGLSACAGAGSLSVSPSLSSARFR